MVSKPWAGRFAKATNELVERFTASIEVDRRLARFDIAGSIAHARMLGRQSIIPREDSDQIVQGLRLVWEEIESGRFVYNASMEDIHMAVEARLREHIGATAGKLHTARSRNDQVALDMRLFTREAIAAVVAGLSALQEVLLKLASEHVETILPGYTHLQRAQPIVLGHHWLAYVEMLQRDKERFHDGFKRVNVLPLGSGALAGVPYPIDRESVARELGFQSVSANSLDAVSDRDFLLEYLAAAAICMMHLSRMAEELVIWSSQEFGFIELDDAFATGSSIMPQKKNPDVAELVRGKTGQVYGNLLALLTTMKGLPLAYNRDLQEDKAGFFTTVDTLLACLQVLCGLMDTVTVRRDRMLSATRGGHLLATDIADLLAQRGLPFREGHHVVGALVAYADREGKAEQDLTLEEYRQFSALFDEAVLGITPQSSAAARDVPGGTAPAQVRHQLQAATARLAQEPPITLPELNPATF